jgi:hypothetical protein
MIALVAGIPFTHKRTKNASAINLGDHPKAAIGYHFKTGHRETA